MNIFNQDSMSKWKRDLVDMLIRHEGMRHKPYTDSVGKLTIGVGRNLTDVGINDEEAAEMLWNDMERVINATWKSFSFIDTLDMVRRNVIYSMVFNMGIKKVRGFKKMIRAVELYNYELAAQEMMDSRWARQVTARAVELSELMRHGEAL